MFFTVVENRIFHNILAFARFTDLLMLLFLHTVSLENKCKDQMKDMSEICVNG